MKHAYLIIAHTNWEQLKMLLTCLDSYNTDIYVHIDKKAKNVPMNELKAITTKSNTEIYSEYKVFWGGYTIVQTELFLFRQAHEKHYDYYHLLSGMDLPIKPKGYIDSFFEINDGYEFIHFDTDERLRTDREIGRRVCLYHFLQNYRRRYKLQIFNSFFTFLERCLLLVQLLLGIDRCRHYPEFQIRYGSQWVSITDDLVSYIIENEDLISKIFRKTCCADELFIQSLVFNSEFRNCLYDRNYDDDPRANMRLIDIKIRGKNGNPYTWREKDWPEISQSPCLFARKFNLSVDPSIIEKVMKNIKC